MVRALNLLQPSYFFEEATSFLLSGLLILSTGVETCLITTPDLPDEDFEAEALELLLLEDDEDFAVLLLEDEDLLDPEDLELLLAVDFFSSDFEDFDDFDEDETDLLDLDTEATFLLDDFLLDDFATVVLPLLTRLERLLPPTWRLAMTLPAAS